MAALGLTAYYQFALAANIYGDGNPLGLRSFEWLPGEPQTLVHVVASSTTHPSKFMGRGPAKLQGEIQVAASGVRTFIADVQTETLRHASWVDADGTEVYVHVYAGTVASITPVAPHGTPAGTKLVRVGFSFICPDQRLYKASDDSTLLGG